nr:NADH dehydrogenase subunit 2 [Epicypta sp. WQY004]
MLKNLSKFIFLFTMVLGTMISISSNSWFGIWMGLEINLLSFIPLMINTNNLLSTEASLKYFLTQAFASSLLLFSMMLFILFFNLNFNLNMYSFYNLFIFIPLLIKSGIPPFHFWFPNVMEGINWMSSLMLLTWQKIAPLLIISYLMLNNSVMIIIIMISTFIGALNGLNQSSLRKIMAFSSINHLGWMLASMMFNENLWMIYFILYTFISFSIIYLFNHFKLFFINQLYSFFFNSFIMKNFFLISFLSMAGLPPFLGFLPKWLVIQSLILMNMNFLLVWMIFMSLITMYFYLRICYSSLMLNYSEIIFNNLFLMKNQLYLMIISFNFITVSGLMMFIYLIFYFY